MTPKEFIMGLLLHAGKRFRNPDDERSWHRDMADMIGSPSPEVLSGAYVILRDNMEDHVFPANGVIKKALAQAARDAAPAGPTLSDAEREHWHRRASARRLKPTPEQIAEEDRTQAWQAEQIAKYGSWEGYHRAVHGGGTSVHRGKPNVGKAAFEAMQNISPNVGMHMTKDGLTERSKAMSGDREDAT